MPTKAKIRENHWHWRHAWAFFPSPKVLGGTPEWLTTFTVILTLRPPSTLHNFYSDTNMKTELILNANSLGKAQQCWLWPGRHWLLGSPLLWELPLWLVFTVCLLLSGLSTPRVLAGVDHHHHPELLLRLPPPTSQAPPSGPAAATWNQPDCLSGSPQLLSAAILFQYVHQKPPSPTLRSPGCTDCAHWWPGPLGAVEVCFLAQHRAGSQKNSNEGVLAFSIEEPEVWMRLLGATRPFQIHTGWVLTRSLLLQQMFFRQVVGSCMMWVNGDLEFNSLKSSHFAYCHVVCWAAAAMKRAGVSSDIGTFREPGNLVTHWRALAWLRWASLHRPLKWSVEAQLCNLSKTILQCVLQEKVVTNVELHI